MFNILFQYWYKSIDTPSIEYKSNLWFYINLKLFKIKLNNFIIYFILNLNFLALKHIKIFYKNYLFENIYNYFIIVTILTCLILSLYL